jgi:hypothetical protein
MYRAKFLMKKLLCTSLRRPPDVMAPELDDLPKDATTRERFEAVERIAECSSCHVVLNPLAFAMESYDPIGRYRTQEENGHTIDPSGALPFTEYTTEPFDSGVEMLEIMAHSPEVQQCFDRQSFRYVAGRAETDGDDPLLRSAFAEFTGNADIRGLLYELVASPSFIQRQRSSP